MAEGINLANVSFFGVNRGNEGVKETRSLKFEVCLPAVGLP
jgi:hypothetical protein